MPVDSEQNQAESREWECPAVVPTVLDLAAIRARVEQHSCDKSGVYMADCDRECFAPTVLELVELVDQLKASVNEACDGWRSWLEDSLDWRIESGADLTRLAELRERAKP